MDIIVALYDNIAHAQLAAERLIDGGIAPNRVYLVTREAERVFQELRESAGEQEEASELGETLERLDIPRKQASTTPEEIEQGGGMIAVRLDGRVHDRTLESIQQLGLVEVTALHGEEGAKLVHRATGNVAAGDFWINVDAAFKRHFQTRYAPKGFHYKTYEPGYRFGYMLGREMAGQDVRWETEWPNIKQRWQGRYRGDWRQFAPAVKQGWYVGQGLEPGREPHVSEIQGTIRTAQYGELLEAQQSR
jgi:hypothetical protein